MIILSSGTFDVQDLLVSECPGPGGGICVSIEYVEGTVSPGALVYAVHIIDGELDFSSMKLVPIRRNMSDNFTIPVAVSGKYSVVAFDLENNNMSVPRIPTSLVADNETIFLSNGESTSVYVNLVHVPSFFFCPFYNSYELKLYIGFPFPQNLPLCQILHLILRASLSLNYQMEVLK